MTSVFSRRKRGARRRTRRAARAGKELGVRAHLLAEGQGQLLAGGVEPVEGVEGVEERADAADAHLFAGGLDDRLGCALSGLKPAAIRWVAESSREMVSSACSRRCFSSS